MPLANATKAPYQVGDRHVLLLFLIYVITLENLHYLFHPFLLPLNVNRDAFVSLRDVVKSQVVTRIRRSLGQPQRKHSRYLKYPEVCVYCFPFSLQSCHVTSTSMLMQSFVSEENG
ncbi:unnamed protein product [Protopolystoma xenopodis]|uniref:Uncharacterized protein n=1 Tax=Protopolystoma xenopodis TaxID=117903 RepID=A0A3S5CMP3_9PLAT|nr:unnamed protein product [Protopolystoma xenopodis]